MRAKTHSQHCEIRITGHIGDLLIKNFDRFQVTILPNGESLISCEVEDQAQLFGILIRIRDLGIPLHQVTCNPPKNNHTTGVSK